MSLHTRLALALIFALGGCSLAPEDDFSLVDPKWVLDYVDTPGLGWISVDDDKQYIIFLSGGEVEGQADCNRCRGSYALGPADSLDVRFGCTRMYCGQESRGDLFQRGLLRATTYEIRGDRLIISAQDEQFVLEAE